MGYLAADVESAAEELGRQLGLSISRRFDRPQFSLFGVYLGDGPGNIEVFSFSDEALVTPRLSDASIMLEHVAYQVDDIHLTAAVMREQGTRFSGPDGRHEVLQPIDLGGVLHLVDDAGQPAGAGHAARSGIAPLR